MSTPRVLWRPTSEQIETSNLTAFADWWARRDGVATTRSYIELHARSVSNVAGFWSALAEYFEVDLTGEHSSVVEGDIADAKWFPGAEVNYAAHALRRLRDGGPALICIREDVTRYTVSGETLRGQVEDFAAFLIASGVVPGDRVAGYLPNTEHAVVAFLGSALVGAIWTCCSPDFGVNAVLDRFAQVEPTVFIATTGYGYGGRHQDRSDQAIAIAAGLPSVRVHVVVELSDAPPPPAFSAYTPWGGWPTAQAPPAHVQVPFEHPLWILYSSGTTGKPKAIVHGHGGCLLEHLKYLSLQADVKPGERFFWFTTTGWMMWNFLQSALLVGGVPVLYDGSPGYPSLERLWRLADELPVHHFGTSAPYLHACMRKGLAIAQHYALAALRSVGSTGAPLSPEGFAYVSEDVKPGVWLSSMSGGTDVCSAFVGGNPWSPVYEGTIQGPALGVDLIAGDPSGSPVVGEPGELLVRQPLPSMPVSFWGDPRGERRRASYFEDVPGVWRHGDFITVDERGGVVIHGRSDATLNRQGVRIGTAEIYRVVEADAAVEGSLVVHYVDAAGVDHMPLFVQLAPGISLSPALERRLKTELRERGSPRHVFTELIAVREIPMTKSGKRLELPVKRLFLGAALDDVVAPGALKNPAALREFVDLARRK